MVETLSLERSEKDILDGVIESIPRDSVISLEGTPVSMDKDWDRSHEIGINLLLHYLLVNLQEDHRVTPVALFDNSNNLPKYNPDYYLGMMHHYPKVVYEADMRKPARDTFNKLQKMGKVLQPVGTTHMGYPIDLLLNSRSQPKLLTVYSPNDWRTHAQLDDVAFQTQIQREQPKRSHIITVHPRQYNGEQRSMREISEAVRSDTSSSLTQINIYFTNKGRISGEPQYNQLFITQ